MPHGGDILPEIASMDAEVITIKTSRSDMELLRGIGDFHDPNEIGPGVCDIHFPRVPTQDAVIRLMRKAVAVVPRENLWINPDCGVAGPRRRQRWRAWLVRPRCCAKNWRPPELALH